MRAETDTGVLLYWPPHKGILYCAAGPVSRNVPIVLIGNRKELGAERGLISRAYSVTVRRESRIIRHSPPLPAAGECIVRPARKVCRDCGDRVEEVDAFGECEKCASKWALQARG